MHSIKIEIFSQKIINIAPSSHTYCVIYRVPLCRRVTRFGQGQYYVSMGEGDIMTNYISRDVDSLFRINNKNKINVPSNEVFTNWQFAVVATTQNGNTVQKYTNYYS